MIAFARTSAGLSALASGRSFSKTECFAPRAANLSFTRAVLGEELGR